MLSSDSLLFLVEDGAPVLVGEKALVLGGGLYQYDPRVLTGTFLVALFFDFKFGGRFWALAMSLKGGSLLLLQFPEQLIL